MKSLIDGLAALLMERAISNGDLDANLAKSDANVRASYARDASAVAEWLDGFAVRGFEAHIAVIQALTHDLCDIAQALGVRDDMDEPPAVIAAARRTGDELCRLRRVRDEAAFALQVLGVRFHESGAIVHNTGSLNTAEALGDLLCAVQASQSEIPPAPGIELHVEAIARIRSRSRHFVAPDIEDAIRAELSLAKSSR